jgi:transcriptional regulator with XRE-family HTH domain
MYEIDNEKFGIFLSQLRKQKGLTQKELAQKVFVSDKAVSKWERGLSMPDIALLSPLADLLGVTVTELLSGQHIDDPEQLKVQDVEKIVTGTIRLSTEEVQHRGKLRKQWGIVYLISVVITALEFALLYALGYSFQQLYDNILLTEALCLLAGCWFCLFVKETLPAYYDENKVHTYSDGIFRMNIAGVNFNNRNWPYILRAGRLWMSAVSVLFPVLYLAMSWFFPDLWKKGRQYFTLLSCLGLFIPMIVAGKRHE